MAQREVIWTKTADIQFVGILKYWVDTNKSTTYSKKLLRMVAQYTMKIAENDYNLSVSSYVEPKDTREKIDIEELNKEVAFTVKKIDKLRSDIDEIIAEIEN